MLTASYAKINLFLEVIGKLPNSYHQVNTVLCSIDLCDFIHYEPILTNEIVFTCSNPSLTGEDNLIYRIVAYLKQRYNIKKGISIHLDKRIPIAAGLGGGSSNAANCILALNDLWQLHLSETDKHTIAASFGSDINFFLSGGTAWGENRGEKITPLPDILLSNILLVNPNIHIPASLAYQLVELPIPDNFRQFNLQDLHGTCFNRLEMGIRTKYPVINEIINNLYDMGAGIAMLSGSGATCFGIFDSSYNLDAYKNTFIDKGYWCHLTSTLPGN